MPWRRFGFFAFPFPAPLVGSLWAVATAACALLCATAVTAAGDNQIVNGSFETGRDPGSMVRLGPGSHGLIGWTIDQGHVYYVGTYWRAADGKRSIAFDQTEASAISQVIRTRVGVRYKVTIAIAANRGLREWHVGVSAAGQDTTFSNFSFGRMKWADYDWWFIAVDKETTLTISGPAAMLSRGRPSIGIDNVRVTVEDY